MTTLIQEPEPIMETIMVMTDQITTTEITVTRIRTIIAMRILITGAIQIAMLIPIHGQIIRITIEKV